MKPITLVVGIVALASAICNLPAQTPPQPAPTAPGGQCDAAPRKERLGEKLGLSPEQKSKIAPLMRKNQESIRAIKQDATLTKEQKHAQIAAIRESMDQQMKTILTPQQYSQWQALRAERMQRQEKGESKTGQ